jgi:Mini-chromosome maintenance replisome factor
MNLCPLLSIFESTTESLSQAEWSPKKNYDTNRLNVSVLGEMPALSNLLIDETKMSEGKIDKNGVENIKAIATLIED